MAERKIYLCNWCHKDAPKAGEIPNDWLVGTDLDGSTKLHLCNTCKLIRRHHLAKALAEAHQTEPVNCEECCRLDEAHKRVQRSTAVIDG